MPGILNHHSGNSVKLLLIGESGSGKTGSLVSLVLAGYKLRIIDLDNGVDIIKNYLVRSTSPYYSKIKDIDLNDAVKVVTFTEKMKSFNGQVSPASANVWRNTMDMLTHWKDGDEDLGKPADWDNNTVVVIDSLSSLSNSAFYFCQSLQGQLGTIASTKGYEMRSDINKAQGLLTHFLQLIYAKEFKPNVILTAHVTFRVPEGSQPTTEEVAGKILDMGGGLAKRGYPDAIGAKLGPKIPRYFNNVIQTTIEGSGNSERHKIITVSRDGVSAKTSAPASIKSSYDISTGLAEIMQVLRESEVG